jgi:hypothetical protein
MRTSYSFNRLPGIAQALGCALTLAGCNGVLGIEAPDETVLIDSGAVQDDSEPDPIATDAGADFEEPTDAGLPAIEIDAGVPAPVETTNSHFATWPMPNPISTGLSHLQSYTVHPAGFVTDEVTHLEWQQAVDERGVAWKDAEAYCKGLAIDGGRFRLPTRIELLSLLDFTAENPAIDGVAFPGTPPQFYWSTSTFAASRSMAWVVNFGAAANILSCSPLDSTYYVRCVRESSDARTRTFATDEDTVKDSATQLVWQRAAPDQAFGFDAAGTYCSDLELDGKGWRLPSIKELQTLVDEARQLPAIDPVAFPHTQTDYYWTASSVTGVEDQAWAVSFRYGFDGAFETKTEQHVRCVR